jgi:hypothetical protein
VQIDQWEFLMDRRDKNFAEMAKLTEKAVKSAKEESKHIKS